MSITAARDVRDTERNIPNTGDAEKANDVGRATRIDSRKSIDIIS
jgi:hypothetical protein